MAKKELDTVTLVWPDGSRLCGCRYERDDACYVRALVNQDAFGRRKPMMLRFSKEERKKQGIKLEKEYCES